MRDRRIIWREVDQIEPAKGHGVELWYEVKKDHGELEAGKGFAVGKILVVFIEGHGWCHRSNKPVVVVTIRPASSEFAGRQLDGEKVVAKAWNLAIELFRNSKLPHND